MKIKGRPVRTTVLFGLLAALAFIPATTVLNLYLPGSQAICLVLWFTITLYGLMLVKWARMGLLGVVFPALLLLLFALLGPSMFAFLILSLRFICVQKSKTT